MSEETTATTKEPKNELLITANPIEIFTGGTARSVIDSIKEAARSMVLDPSTEKGRKEIASLAYKIARTKTALDDAGKSLTEEQRKLIDRVNEERRFVRDELDTLKDEIRRPLTEYEEREKARVAGHESRIAAIAALDANLPADSAGIARLIAEAKATDLNGFDEFKQKAEMTLQAALHRLQSAFTIAKEDEERRIVEEAERRRLEAERLERERLEREEREKRIAAEAAEKARIEAEQKAAEEARKAEEAREAERKAEAARLAAIEAEKAEAAAAAERERLAAEERHQRELREAKEEADRQERNRLAAIEAERVAEEKRAANEKHRKAILFEIASDLANEAHLVDELAGAVAQVLASGKIRHITINF